MSEVMEREEQLTPELEPQTEPEKSSLKAAAFDPLDNHSGDSGSGRLDAVQNLWRLWGQDGDRDHDRGGAVRLDYCHSGGQRYDPRKEQRGHYHHHCRYHV